MYNLKCKYMKKNQEPDLVLQIWQKKTWMMMRLVGLICLWCLLGVPKVGYAQARLVSLEVKDTPIKQVLRVLGSEYGKEQRASGYERAGECDVEERDDWRGFKTDFCRERGEV